MYIGTSSSARDDKWNGVGGSDAEHLCELGSFPALYTGISGPPEGQE